MGRDNGTVDTSSVNGWWDSRVTCHISLSVRLFSLVLLASQRKLTFIQSARLSASAIHSPHGAAPAELVGREGGWGREGGVGRVGVVGRVG